MIVVRPCSPDHPNAIVWDAKHKGAGALCKVLYDSMGWDTDYSFRIPCQTITGPNGDTVLVYDMDNYVGRASAKKDESIIAQKETAAAEEYDDAKSYYYPPDQEEPQEIRDMEERFQEAVETNKKLFGTPVFEHIHGLRGIETDSEWDMMTEARPLDIMHTVDSATVSSLLLAIKYDPPKLPQKPEAYPGEPVTAENGEV